MGVLDDAIREHLDLKRRHGVAEEELRRQEEEALGPARREVAPSEADEAGNGAAAEAASEPELSEALPESALRSDLHEEEVAVDGESVVDEAPPPGTGDTPQGGFEELDDDGPLDEEEPPLEEESPLAGEDDEPLPDEEPLAEEEPLPREASFTRDEAAEDDEPAEDEPAEGEDPDLLEDTPDFLQETPEHDRLWFEQKPPRDFDFD